MSPAALTLLAMTRRSSPASVSPSTVIEKHFDAAYTSLISTFEMTGSGTICPLPAVSQPSGSAPYQLTVRDVLPQRMEGGTQGRSMFVDVHSGRS